MRTTVAFFAGVIAAALVALLIAHWPAVCAINGSVFWTAAGAIGSASAAVVAVGISTREGRRRDRRVAARGRIVASHLFTPCRGLMVALDLVAKQGAVFSAILPGSASTAVTDSAAALNAACTQIAESVRFFNVDDATYLPAYIGERLAVGIGAAELVMGSTRAAIDMYFAADSDPNPDSVRFEAASDFIGHRTATVATANVRIFMDWCRKEFEEKSGA